MGNEFSMEGFKKGDNHEFKKIFDEYNLLLSFFVGSLVKNKDDADDIVIHTFAKLYEGRANFDTEQNIKSFLYIAVRNASLNHLQSKKNRKAREALFQSSMPNIEDAHEVMVDMIEAELLAKFHRAIEDLPDGCKNVFKLRYLDGLSNDEIAQKLGISYSTVTTQMSRAIEALKKIVG